jgi:hypothetical protein
VFVGIFFWEVRLAGQRAGLQAQRGSTLQPKLDDKSSPQNTIETLPNKFIPTTKGRL